MAYICPPKFVVYLKEQPGYTLRIALDPNDIPGTPPEKRGYKRAEDQESPVYTVLRKRPDGSVEQGGETWSEEERKQKMAVIETELKRQKSLRSTAFEFATAHKRLALEGRVPTEVAQYRLTVCTGLNVDGQQVSDKCPNYVNENGRRGSGHCEGCGCPKWEISEMDTGKTFPPGKAWYPMGCPKGRFAEHDGRRKRGAETSISRPG